MHSRASFFARASLTVSAFASLFLAAPAGAQEEAPTLASMDRVGDDSRLGLDAAYTRFAEDDLLGELSTLRFDLYGRYVHPSGGGVAASLPFTAAWADEDSEYQIGNASVFALYNVGPGPVRVFTRAGIVLPTADDEDGGSNLLGGLGRLGDFSTGLPETTSLVFAISPQIKGGRFFTRADLGVDFVVDEPEGQDDFGPLVHISAAAGVDTGPVDVSAEIVNEFNLGEDEDDALHNLGFTASYTGGQVRPHVGFVVPFGSDITELVDFVVLAGVSGAIGRGAAR
jgi:hypothetical protein